MSTEVTIQGNTTRPLYRKLVRDGVAGNYEVVYEMIRLIRNGVDYDKGVESQAKAVLINNNLNSLSSAQDQLEAVFSFVRANVTYIQDIAGRTESLKSARQTLSDGYGDCDDQTILNATLLGCLGFESVKIAMAKYSKDADSFGHVYCVVYVNGKRFVLDTTLPNAELNKEVKAAEVREIGVFENVQGLDGFSGIYNNTRYHARRAARTVVRTLPSATNFLPLGFIAGNALATGASLIEKSAGDTLSLSNTATQINEQLDKIILDLLQSRIAYDLAKSYALQLAAQLMAVEVTRQDHYAFEVVSKSVKSKLEFISNFKQYAEVNNIRLVHLDSSKMLYAGLALALGTGYIAYQQFYKKRF